MMAASSLSQILGEVHLQMRARQVGDVGRSVIEVRLKNVIRPLLNFISYLLLIIGGSLRIISDVDMLTHEGCCYLEELMPSDSKS